MISFFSGGDFRHFYSENIPDFITFPFAWDSSLNTGIGHSQIGSLWIITYFNFTLLFNKLGISWSLISLIFWILPAILLSFFSSFYLFKTLLPNSKRYGLLAGFIYLFNTYFLIVLTGGQLGVALAYSVAPLVIIGFIRVIRSYNLRNSIIASLLLALQVLFDPRIAYLSMTAVVLYFVLSIKYKVSKKIRLNTCFLILYTFAIPIGIAVAVHSFWILPLILFRSSPIPEGFASLSGFEFFSFADFSHAFSLLHPNWPENIFGKIYFLQPEFLILPILAFLSLLFVDRSKVKSQKSKLQVESQKSENNLTIKQFNHKIVLYFAILGLLGGFLAKGVNPPFGEINQLLFQYFPGMNMFRDPTKFYILIALSYSILIPYSISNFSIWINSKFKIQNSKSQVKIQNVSILIGILFLLFLVRPLFVGELRGKLTPGEVPREYIQLKDLLVSQPQFFRTLWIPQWQRFGFFSNNHPAIGREEVLRRDAPRQVKELKNESTISLLKNLSVKYVIVPFDSEGEIFLEDRKYDEDGYQRTVQDLKNIRELKQVQSFGKNAVFELEDYKDHFWSPSTDLRINYNFLSPTEYKVDVRNAKKGYILVFSEGFDKNWMVENSDFRIQSSKFKDRLNSFNLPKEGNYSFKVYYSSQRWVNIGFTISGTTILAVLGLLGLNRMKNK